MNKKEQALRKVIREEIARLNENRVAEMINDLKKELEKFGHEVSATTGDKLQVDMDGTVVEVKNGKFVIKSGSASGAKAVRRAAENLRYNFIIYGNPGDRYYK